MELQATGKFPLFFDSHPKESNEHIHSKHGFFFFFKLLDPNVYSISVWTPLLSEERNLRAGVVAGPLGFQFDG